MSTTRHKPQEAAAPRRQYQASVVVPLVVFAFLAGAAAGYSIGRMGRDDCTEALPVISASHAFSMTRTTAQQPQPEQRDTPLRALGVQCLD